jgi:hypothetical protein
MQRHNGSGNMAKINPAILSLAGEALMAGDVSAAILACKADAKEPFNESQKAKIARLIELGIDGQAAKSCIESWQVDHEEREARILESILTRTPKALADCPPEYLPPLRVAAALMELFGEGVSFIRKLISVEDDYNYRFKPDAVCLMLHAYGCHLDRLSEMAAAGFTKVQVSSSLNPDECAACRNAHGKVFPIADAPEVPLPNCDCPRACSCIVLAVG